MSVTASRCGSNPHAVRFNPYEPGFTGDPYPQYRLLREHDPVHRSFMGTWVLSRYRDVESVLRDPAFSSDLRNWSGFERRYKNKPSVAWMLNRSVLNVDPPEHGTLRKCVTQAFAPTDYPSFTKSIENTVEQYIAKLKTKPDGFDAVQEFALPLPLEVICDIYGVALADREKFKRWSLGVSRLIEPLPSMEAFDDAGGGIDELVAWLNQRLDADAGNDFPGCMARLVKAGRLSREHALANLILMFPAGHETTINLISNGLFTLLRHPNQWEELRSDMGLLDDAIEEMLRFESPQQLIWRAALEPREIGGVTIQPGEQVMGLLGAANRDPEVFPDPDEFQIKRKPNPHLAFGLGRHGCLGFWFAKHQARVALRRVIEEFPNLMLDPGQPAVWSETLSFHGLKKLPVVLNGAALS